MLNITVLSFRRRLISLTLIIKNTDSAVSSSCESKVDKMEHTNLSAGINLKKIKITFPLLRLLHFSQNLMDPTTVATQSLIVITQLYTPSSLC